MTQFASALASGRFVLTAEVTPPLSLSPEPLLEKVRPLAGLADAVNVTDSASARAAMDPVAAAALMLGAGVEPIVQLTCRDRNRIALQGAIVGAAALGVRAFLFLTGDKPEVGDQPEAKGVFEIGSADLVRTAAGIGAGLLPGGRAVADAVPLLPGVADCPIDPPDDWRPAGLRAKIEAGARFAQTQFCMDVGIARRYAARLRESGLPEDFRLIVGVAPLASARSAAWIRANLFGAIIPDAIVARLEAAADPKAEGAAICVETIAALAEIPGVAGAHVMAPLNEKAVPGVLEAARKTLS
ncbi:MAG: methylenetetrahydrofolate reductase [Sphingomonadaceae bacterium]|nr:methylenetetrahydrofolate reductase [Sphingomonadaceae bacterium]